MNTTPPSTDTIKIAAIGDIHAFWNAQDTNYFNESDYDLLLFTGDLAKIVGGIADAEKLSALNKAAIVIPGNHDGSGMVQFIAELKSIPSLCQLSSVGQGRRMKKFQRALGEVAMGGFSLHRFNFAERELAVIAGRPHSMGGDRLYFRPYIKRQFGVSCLQESTQKLCTLVDQAPEELIFLAHNGPAGLGDTPQDIWGCDFNPALGDFGDSDLAQAIDYARASGRRVRAVVAGHMHQALKGSELRKRWALKGNDTLYVNAARVPRIFQQEGQLWHHHVELTITDQHAHCAEVLVNDRGEEHRSLQPL